MTSNWNRAALVAGLFAAVWSVPAYADSGPKISPAVAKPLLEAQKLMAAGDLKTALDMVHEAQAVPGRTAFDDYEINQFVANIAVGQKDFPTAATAYEALADSPMLDQDENKVSTLSNAVILSSSIQHYQKSLQYGDRLAALGPLTYKVQGTLAIDYFDLHDFAHAKDLAQKAIDGAKAAGQQPDPNWLSVMVNSQMKSNDTAGAEASMEQLAATSGSPDAWANIIRYGIDHWKPREIDAIDLLRLAVVTNAAVSASDYTFMAGLALRKGYPGDALTASRHGGSAPGAAAKAATDERDLPREEAASKSQKGEFSVQLAEDYYGYGRYAEAEAAARRAIEKGGVKDPGEGHMVLGMALVGLGRPADAAQAFQAVSGGTGETRAAHLWMLYAQSKSAPASASAH